MAYQAQKISVPISFRIGVVAKAKAEGIRRCWAAIAKVKGEDVNDKGEVVEMDPSHVYRTLLEQRIDEEVASLTGGRGFPAADDQKSWDAVLKSIADSISRSKK